MTDQELYITPGRCGPGSSGQQKNAEKLCSKQNSEGKECVRPVTYDTSNARNFDFPAGYFERGIIAFIVESTNPYIVTRNMQSEWTCRQMDQDSTPGPLCKGFAFCKGNKRERICKHIMAVDLKFGPKLQDLDRRNFSV